MDTFTCRRCDCVVDAIVDGLCQDCWEERQRDEELDWQEYMEGEFGRNYTDGIGY